MRLMPAMASSVAIIGFGFSGLMVTYQLVTALASNSTIYVIAEDLRGLGMAYGTEDVAHLLNVPAGRMGATPDAVDGFFRWLYSAEGALAKQRLKLKQSYQAGDFVPRALYGAYLSDIWQRTQDMAIQQRCTIKLVEATATRIVVEPALAVLTSRGDAIAVDKIVLAIGNETKRIFPHLTSPHIIQNPWAPGVFDGAASWASPVMVMGAGLTAIDTLVSLRRSGYTGEVLVASRHGKWPEKHAAEIPAFTFDAAEIFSQQRLQHYVRLVRKKIKVHGEWRAVIDALRPHTQAMWQRLSMKDQQRFIRRLMPLWNIHRHRMAPQIATVPVQACRSIEVQQEGDTLTVTLQQKDSTTHRVSRLINCTGTLLDVTKTGNMLLRQMLADRVVEPHANGLGIAVDPYYRAWGAAHPNLFVIGTLMTGQWLESTAVPELRVQAAAIAATLGEA